MNRYIQHGMSRWFLSLRARYNVRSITHKVKYIGRYCYLLIDRYIPLIDIFILFIHDKFNGDF